MPADEGWRYVHGHAEPVLRSHRWRDAANSAGYLLDHLRDGLREAAGRWEGRILDVGCGPATITADLGRRFPASTVHGIDPAEAVIAQVADLPPNVTVAVGDLFDQDPADGTYDVVHAHQVLKHLPDPFAALVHMRRLCAPGGIVAVRDVDYAAMTWAPAVPELDTWLAAYRTAHRAAGAEPDAGRHLLGWALEAGFEGVKPSASVWCFATPEDRRWWAGLWADRVTAPESRLAQQLRADGTGEDDLTAIATAWRDWAERPDAWFAVLHGERIARAPSDRSSRSAGAPTAQI